MVLYRFVFVFNRFFSQIKMKGFVFFEFFFLHKKGVVFFSKEVFFFRHAMQAEVTETLKGPSNSNTQRRQSRFHRKLT